MNSLKNSNLNTIKTYVQKKNNNVYVYVYLYDIFLKH